MTREQAINYLICRGITEYRVSEIVRALTYEPTTKNNLPRCQHTDEEIAKSFIEDVEAVKDQLPCFCEQMDFPNTFDEFANFYGFKDKDEVYTNGSELIPVFRVKQWLEHISTTKNNLGVEEVTALAEWTEKLTKECEEAYNKGYADGMKEQEPFKPMVEIDLYSVIKQKYIEREVLDKIRAEIVEMRSKQNVGVLECLDIIDKYKAESEDT